MSQDLPILKLRRGEDRRLNDGHTWVFSNEIDTKTTPLTAFAPGDLVRVVSDRDREFGVAYVNPGTLIAARLLTRAPGVRVDGAWLEMRLRSAVALRASVGVVEHGRIVYGESDELPGLVLDRYGDVFVGQIGTAGMERMRPALEAAIRAVWSPRVMVWKNDSASRLLEGLTQGVETAWGELPATVTARERGTGYAMQAPLSAGQKTGWFYDQADNRAAMARYVRPGARVLDVCSYVGGWALAALAAGAGEATCLDSSTAALEFVQANARALGRSVATLQGDAFEQLAALAGRGERFDLVVLDPPAFIKRRRDQPQGEAAYRKLNQLAMGVLADDARLVSCSCSHHLPETALAGAVQGAARRSGRLVQVLQFGAQSADHPVHPAIPETRYLKALFCRVTR